MQLWDLVDELVLNFAFGLGFCLFVLLTLALDLFTGFLSFLTDFLASFFLLSSLGDKVKLRKQP